jgi:hypothetical protein
MVILPVIIESSESCYGKNDHYIWQEASCLTSGSRVLADCGIFQWPDREQQEWGASPESRTGYPDFSAAVAGCTAGYAIRRL